MNEERKRIVANMIYILIDMANGYSYELESLFRKEGQYFFQDKRDIEKLKFVSDKIVRIADRTLKTEEKQLEFGETSDLFKSILEELIKFKTEEQVKQLFASIKLIAKDKKECTNISQETL